MKLVLTRKSDNMEIIIDSDLIPLMEPEVDGLGTHMVVGPGLVRVVNESMASISAAIGVTAPKAVAAASVAEMLAKPAKRAAKK